MVAVLHPWKSEFQLRSPPVNLYWNADRTRQAGRGYALGIGGESILARPSRDSARGDLDRPAVIAEHLCMLCYLPDLETNQAP
jgi:hypothetical protein